MNTENSPFINLQRAKVVYRPRLTLKRNPKNPRRHDRKQVRKIASSIQAFGFNVPILVDKNLDVIAGHGRLDAAELLGIEQVPTICLDHLSPKQAQAFVIA